MSASDETALSQLWHSHEFRTETTGEIPGKGYSPDPWDVAKAASAERCYPPSRSEGTSRYLESSRRIQCRYPALASLQGQREYALRRRQRPRHAAAFHRSHCGQHAPDRECVRFCIEFLGHRITEGAIPRTGQR